MSISAFYILRRRHVDFAQRSFTLALIFGAGSSLAIGLSGHFQARTVARTQPAKLAAFEGHFHTGKGDLHLFGLPDPEAKKVKYGLAVPGLLSFLVYETATRSGWWSLTGRCSPPYRRPPGAASDPEPSSIMA
jgi:cytochrome d ubiquinol oxidase subunit I